MVSYTLHILENEYWQVGVLPTTGASIAFGRIRQGDDWLDLLRPTAEENYGNRRKTASPLMMPWVSRIAEARFRFQGVDYQLNVNHEDGTAIHGVVWEHPWKIVTADQTHIVMTFASTDYEQVNFPFAFTAEMEYRLAGADFVLRMALKNDDQQPMPGGFGSHLYFMRALGSPENTARLEVPCDQQFRLENLLTDPPLVSVVEQHVDFRQLRPVEPEKFAQTTDCMLTGWQAGQPVRIVYPKTGTTLVMIGESVFRHVIVYAPKGEPFMAVEPVTNAVDGFNLLERGVTGTGVFVLQPGEAQQGIVRLTVSQV